MRHPSVVKLTVCELLDDPCQMEKAWDDLAAHVKSHRSDFVLLPEMPFYPWFPYLPQYDESVWRKAVEAHNRKVSFLSALSPAAVLGTRPVEQNGKRLNQAFYWTGPGNVIGVRDKYFMPDEEGFYESRWFHRNGRRFEQVSINGVYVGFLVCTEAMFSEWARHYGREGAHIIAVPRATGAQDRWNVAARMAAIVSGAFVMSSNRTGRNSGNGFFFGGCGWIYLRTVRCLPPHLRTSRSSR